jgi:hypothetical protein
MPVAIRGTGGGSVTLSSGAAATDTTLTLPNTTGTVALTASPTFSGTLTATTVTSPASTALTIQSAGTTAMTVDTSQNVGIGTSSPTAKLVVNGGTSTSQIRLEVNNAAFTQEVSTNAAASAYVYKSNDASYHVWKLSSSEAMRIDSSGNLGIGTSSPGRKLDIEQASTDYQMRIGDAGGNYYDIGRNTGNGLLTFNGNQAAASGYVFSTVNGERARIDTSGNLLVGTTSSVNGGSVISVAAGTVCSIITAATASTNMIVFRNGNGNVGSITTSGTATSYNTGSDYRLKHDVEPMTSGLATLAALNPVTYKWNADDSDGEGFIAHELAEVIPLAVTGEKNAVDADGNPVHQGVDYSKIVVHLVAAIQELSAKNDALEARLAALEAK